MRTTTTTRTAAQPGAAIITAYNLETELAALYAAQALWLKEQARLSDAACLLEDHGCTISPRRSWCWSSSPHAPRIAEIETILGI
jgi:hypothetical protein